MLSNSNRNILLNRCTKIESYDKILHNKVYGNLFILIPKGIKVLLMVYIY